MPELATTPVEGSSLEADMSPESLFAGTPEPVAPAATETTPAVTPAPVETPAVQPDPAAPVTPAEPAAQPPGSTAAITDQTAKVIADAMDLHARRSQQPPAPAAPRQMTAEEIDEKFKVVRVTPQDVAALGLDAENPATVTALNGLLHRTAQMATAIMTNHVQLKIQEVLGHIAPLQQHAEAQIAEQMKADFFAQHKDLIPYEPLLVVIKNDLLAQGWRGDKDATFKKIADTARGLLDTTIKAGQQPAGATPVAAAQPTTPPTTRKMSTLSGGGQGGAGSGVAAEKTGPEAIFGD